MRPILITLLFVLPPQGLTDLDKSRAELHTAKVQLLACQEQLVSVQVQAQRASLTEEQAKLEARFREILKPKEGAVFSWERLTFEDAK